MLGPCFRTQWAVYLSSDHCLTPPPPPTSYGRGCDFWKIIEGGNQEFFVKIASDQPSRYQQNFINLYCFALFYPLLCCIRCYFLKNTGKLIVYLRNLSDNNFLFLFFIFGDIFLGAHNFWTLPFVSVNTTLTIFFFF